MLGENEDEDNDPDKATLADDMVRAAMITEMLNVSSLGVNVLQNVQQNVQPLVLLLFTCVIVI